MLWINSALMPSSTEILQTRTLPSAAPDAITFVPSATATAFTEPVCPSRVCARMNWRASVVLDRHIRTVRSTDPVTRSFVPVDEHV